MEKINISEFIEKIKSSSINDYETYIGEKFEFLIKSCYKENLIIFLHLIKDIPSIRSIIKANYYTIVEQSSVETLESVLKLIQEIDPKINFKKFEDNELHDMILSKMLFIDVKTLKEEKIIEFFRELFNEILLKENITMANIECLGSGTTVDVVLRCGAVVFKIGGERRCKEIPYSSVCLPSLYREAIYSIHNPSKLLCFCELQPYAPDIEEYSDFECYREEAKKQLRNDRIIHFDDILTNYGGPIKDPSVFERYGNGFDLSFQGFTGKEYLSKDELKEAAKRLYFIRDIDDFYKY